MKREVKRKSNFISILIMILPHISLWITDGYSVFVFCYVVAVVCANSEVEKTYIGNLKKPMPKQESHKRWEYIGMVSFTGEG